MIKQSKIGICHICGTEGELTFEHTPMREAFNKSTYISASKKDIVQRIANPGIIGIPKGRVEQGGIGDYTLCGNCNNKTGRWYGNQYLKWCEKGFEIMIRSDGRPSLFNIYYIQPLALIKQIASFFCSINHNTFGRQNPELQKFILNKERKGLPSKYRFFCYFCIDNWSRAIGNAHMMNFETGQIIPISEFSFPPFGYVMTFNSKPPDKRLFEITHFSRYGYNEFADMKLKFCVLPTDSILPGIYLSKDEIAKRLGQTPPSAP